MWPCLYNSSKLKWGWVDVYCDEFLNVNFLVKVLTFDDYANDVEFDDGVSCRCLCRWIITWYTCCWLLIVLNLYMLKVDVEWGDCMCKIGDDYWRRFVVNICIVVESYAHAMTDGDGFCINIGDEEYFVFNYWRRLWCFCCIMRWRPWWRLVPHEYMCRV